MNSHFTGLLALVGLISALVGLFLISGCASVGLPNFGRVYELNPVAKSIIGQDGWIDSDAIRDCVYNGITTVIGPADPVMTLGPRRWINMDLNGRRFTSIGGDFTTDLVPTPATVLHQLPTPIEMSANAFRSIHIRYWTESGESIAKPGRCYIAVEVRTSATIDGVPALVLLPATQTILTADLVEAISNAVTSAH